MPQVFHPSTNVLSKVIIFGGLIMFGVLVWILSEIGLWSSFRTEARVAQMQPVPFSHEHHVGDDGIDCRYCHISVENSSFADIPPTHTCMSCHSQIWSNSAMLEPVRESYHNNTPIKWNRIYNLPEFVYFNHSIHVQKGVGCVTCHGRVDKMPLLYKAQPLHMGWCLNCHRHPERFIRPREYVFSMDWKPPINQIAMGKGLMKKYDIETDHLTNCTTCHR